jgi:hypothetical protein
MLEPVRSRNESGPDRRFFVLTRFLNAISVYFARKRYG